MKRIFTLLSIALLTYGAQAQQDPMLTQYMFNTLSYNPAYAGSRDYLSATILHRDQWLGFNDNEGKPSTQIFSIHSPVHDKRAGVGFTVSRDNIGATQNYGLQAQYAYRIPAGKGHLALGLQGGMNNFRTNFSDISLQDPNDAAFTTNDELSQNLWLPNFGAGLYFSTPSFYFGFSVPHILNNDMRRQGIDPDSDNLFASQYRHYYATGGVVIRLSESVHFKPSFLIKNVGLFKNFREDDGTVNTGIIAPTQYDLDASFLFNETLWLGASFRSAFEGLNDTTSYDSIDFWMSLQVSRGLRIGVAYDYHINQIKNVSNGSYEVMLGYDLEYNNNKIVTPRYF